MSDEKCRFIEAWIGRCKETPDESGFCKKHKGKKCASCGAIATRNCEETGQFVCGADLCDDCEHTLFPDGSNGGIGFNAQRLPEGVELKSHCKRTEQPFSLDNLRKNREKLPLMMGLHPRLDKKIEEILKESGDE